jgi:RNA polymerase sigma-70 factor, ECF subfamily
MKTEGQDEFVEFWQQTWDRVRAYMFCACHNSSDADDLTQDCFMRALRSWSAFQGTGTRRAWLFAIARSTQVDWIRRQRRQRRAAEEHRSDDKYEVATGPSLDDAEAISQAVQRLALDQQEVVHLRFAAGLSYAEIAEMLRVPIGTVRSRLCRGLQSVRKLVEE